MNVIETAKLTLDDVNGLTKGTLPMSFMKSFDLAFFGCKTNNMPKRPEYKRVEFGRIIDEPKNPFDLYDSEFSYMEFADDNLDEIALFVEYGNYTFRILYDIRDFSRYYVKHRERFSNNFQSLIQRQLSHFFYDDLVTKDKIVKSRIRKRDFYSPYTEVDFQKFKDLSIIYFKELTRINKYLLNK